LALAWRASFPRHKAIDVLRRAVQASSAAYWNYNTVPDQGRPVISVENSDW
jgi:LysR family hydrogen peroxide-inducible transcriptional activator